MVLKITFSIAALCVLLLCLSYAEGAYDGGGFQTSYSVDEAKARKTLVTRLKPSKYRLKTTADNEIVEAWVEKCWEYAPYGFTEWLLDKMPMNTHDDEMVVVKFKNEQNANSIFTHNVNSIFTHWELGLNRKGGGGAFSSCTQTMGLGGKARGTTKLYVLQCSPPDFNRDEMQITDSVTLEKFR